LANPLTAGSADKVDYKAKTFAVETQCVPITQQCLRNVQWPINKNGNFSCTPAFRANFTFPGASETEDVQQDDADFTVNQAQDKPSVGLAFASDAELSKRIGSFDPSLAKKLENDRVESFVGTNLSYKYLQPANPLYFAIWASGYPGFNLNFTTKSNDSSTNPLFADSQVYQSLLSTTSQWILKCNATVYDVTNTWVNGAIQDFHTTSSSPEIGALISARFALDVHERDIVLRSIATTVSPNDAADHLANAYADAWSQAALALSAGVVTQEANLLSQVRSTESVIRVPKGSLYVLLALKAIYVLAVVALAIGAYCFTHPAETEIVKSQLSTRGLAATHFDIPDILQSKVVSELSERLQPATNNTNNKNDPADPEYDPGKNGLKRAATFLGDIQDKRIGVVAQADGAWRFTVVANGVWIGIKPLAVDFVGIEAKAGSLGEPGDLVKAWMK
jgi:hypothetical protein